MLPVLLRFTNPKLLFTVAFLWMAILCTLIVCADLISPQALLQLDYLTSFHVAGWLVTHHQSTLLYPPVGTMTFAGAPFDIITHQLSPALPKSMVAVFMYCPIVAYIFAPASWLPSNIGLLAWQTINFILLILSTWCAALVVLDDNHSSGRATPSGTNNAVSQPISIKNKLSAPCNSTGFAKHMAVVVATTVACTFFYLPVFNTIWLGQVDIAFCLFPLAVGCLLISRGYTFLAGLCWSLVFLKPQLLPAASILCLAYGMRKNLKPLAGLLLGVLLLLILNVILVGESTMANWLSSLRISETLFSGTIRNPEYLVGSLPGAIITFFPPAERMAVKFYAYGLGFILAFINIWFIWVLSKANLRAGKRLQLNIVAAILPIIVYSPRLLTYDWSVLVLPIMLVLFNRRVYHGIVPPLLALAALVNLEIIAQVTASAYANPLLLMCLSIALIAWLAHGILKLSNDPEISLQ